MAKKPNGTDLMAILVSLYAEQEGVSITYEIERKYIDENE